MPTKPTGRPRGRPPGSKNRPKTIEGWVEMELTSPPPKPPKERKAKAAPRGPWAGMTKEERSAYAKKLAAASRAPGITRSPANDPGRNPNYNRAQWAEKVAQAKTDTRKIMERMKAAGQLPDDPRAVEALEATVTTLRLAESPKDKIAAARLILDFTKAKPAQKSEVTIKSAEDFLDEMLADD